MLNRNVLVASFVVAALAMTSCTQKNDDAAVTDDTGTSVGETITNEVGNVGDAAIEGAQTAGAAIADGATATADGAINMATDGATELAEGTKNTLNPVTDVQANDVPATEIKVPADQQY